MKPDVGTRKNGKEKKKKTKGKCVALAPGRAGTYQGRWGQSVNGVAVVDICGCFCARSASGSCGGGDRTCSGHGRRRGRRFEGAAPRERGRGRRRRCGCRSAGVGSVWELANLKAGALGEGGQERLSTARRAFAAPTRQCGRRRRRRWLHTRLVRLTVALVDSKAAASSLAQREKQR